MFKTVNSVFFDPKYGQTAEAEVEVMTTPDSCFTNSSESASISTESEEYLNINEYSSVETIVRGASDTNKGGGDDDGNDGLPYKESVAMAIDSNDPQGDFKKSMEEMVESHGIKDWECLEELLGWYLRMNGKNHHELIVGAFLELLSGISIGGASCSDHSAVSFASVASSFSSPLSKGEWFVLVKSISQSGSNDAKQIRYEQAHEAARKDVERAFCVLKKKWAI
ncbi:transcription repressor OFP13, partial [Tanacetum coccineum]